MIYQSNQKPALFDPQMFWFWKVLSSQTMVLYTWTALVILPTHFYVWLTTECAVDVPSLQIGMSWVIGTTRMVLELPTMVRCGSSTEAEVLVWYAWTAGGVEWLESTVVWYLIQQVLTRPYTLECTQQTWVRECHVCAMSSYSSMDPV